VREEKAGIWDLWVYGGQLPREGQLQGVGDAWVLSMPSFTWTRVEIPMTSLVNIRSMNCHAVGGQLLVVGGFPPGNFLEPNTTCDREMIKVLNLNGPSWESTYNPNSKYRAPEAVRNTTTLANLPVLWASDSVRIAFTPPPKGGPSPSEIAGIVVGAVVGLGVLVFAIWLCLRRLQRVAVADITTATPPDPQLTQMQELPVDPSILSRSQSTEMPTTMSVGMNAHLLENVSPRSEENGGGSITVDESVGPEGEAPEEASLNRDGT